MIENREIDKAFNIHYKRLKVNDVLAEDSLQLRIAYMNYKAGIIYASMRYENLLNDFTDYMIESYNLPTNIYQEYEQGTGTNDE